MIEFFNNPISLSHIAGLVFDLDGTLYLGEEALPGAVQARAALRAGGKCLVFVSNKPLEPRRAYAAKLARLGISAQVEDVITSTGVLGAYLARHAPDLRLYVLGEPETRSELRSFGLHLVDDLPGQDARRVIDPQGIDAVVVAFDRTLDYRKLNIAYQALVGGARFFATNADRTCPMPGGAIPDAGATLAALAHICGREPELIAGKPSPLILQTAMQRLGLPAGRCMMVGDRLETDMRMGREAGMLTALPLTGVTRRQDLLASGALQPDFVIENVGELVNLLDCV